MHIRLTLGPKIQVSPLPVLYGQRDTSIRLRRSGAHSALGVTSLMYE